MANNILGGNNSIPYGNINLKYASDGVHYPGGFGSNETSLQFGLPNPFRDNISAANASNLKGGRKRKKNITYKYKKMGKKKSRRVKSRTGGKRKSRRVKRTMKNGQKGGDGRYHQFGSNIPSTASYSTGGLLNPNESYLANPVKFDKLGGNVVDNYNYNTNKGFQFW
jgi:hypothetical protein